MTDRAETSRLGQLITAARGDLPMRELARRSGLSAAAISRIEGGSVENPTGDTVTRLAVALDRDPELLRTAIGRVDDDEAVSNVSRAAVQLGSSLPPDLQDAAEALDQAHERVENLETQHLSLLSEVASLASEHDMLRAESVELEQEIKRIDSAEAFKDDPGAISSLREEAEKWEKRLSRVRSELAATEKTLEGVNRRMAACEAALSEALTSRTALARQLAGELFLLGARTDSVTILDLRGALTDAIADWSEAAESDWEPESDPRFAELVQKAVVARQAEIDELTRRLRNESVHHPGDPDFRRLAAAWSRLTPQRRARLLEFAEDQRRLSLQEGVEREEVVAIEERASARKTRR